MTRLKTHVKGIAMTDLKHKTIVITGASQGIGAAAARHLATEGATIFLAARTSGKLRALAREIAERGGTAHAVTCDVSRSSDVAALVDEAISMTGRLDVFVNNAGIIDPIARLEGSQPETWGRVVDINLKGVYHGIRFAAPPMIAQGQGTIINISSGAATSALEGWSHYCATKAAVLSLTRVADNELRDKGIRVIGLSPGTVATEMQLQIKASGINPVSKLDPSAHLPPSDVARAIAWLLRPEADAHLGTDFSLKTPEGRAAVGLAPIG